MRPILWGTIWLVIGLIGWAFFGFLAGLSKFAEGEFNPVAKFLVALFGFIFFFSIPVAVIFEIVRWLKKGKKEK